MDMAETTKKQSKDAAKEERKRRVLDATIKCVQNNGFHSTSMSEIANEANISVGIIYRYFENKEAIIEALVEQEIEERNIKFDKLNNTPDEELLRTFLKLIPEVVDRACMCDVSNIGLEIMSEAARNSRVANIVKKAEQHSSNAAKAVLKRIVPNLNNEYIDAYSDFFQIFFDGMMVLSVIKPDFNKKLVSQIMLKIITDMTKTSNN